MYACGMSAKRASYREGVEWIAENDDAGSDDAWDVERVAAYVSTCLLADLFGKSREDVARAVIRYRKKTQLPPGLR